MNHNSLKSLNLIPGWTLRPELCTGWSIATACELPFARKDGVRGRRHFCGRQKAPGVGVVAEGFANRIGVDGQEPAGEIIPDRNAACRPAGAGDGRAAGKAVGPCRTDKTGRRPGAPQVEPAFRRDAMGVD